MTDITPAISALTEKHAGQKMEENYHTSQNLDSFLQEAYRINSHITSLLTFLRAIRRPYLSAAPPPRHLPPQINPSSVPVPTHLSDPQRTAIDTQTSTLLHDLSSNITSLTTAENLRVSTESAILEQKYPRPNTALWRWAAGGTDPDDPPKSLQQRQDEGKAWTIKTFREGVLWYLQRELARAAARQREMVEIRVSREREREKSTLWKLGVNSDAADYALSRSENSSSPAGMNGYTPPDKKSYSPVLDDRPPLSSDPSADLALTPEQAQLFASENSTLLTHYTDSLSRISQAEKSIIEIASLQQTLVSHLNVQGELIEQLVTDAQGTDENLRRGNRELKKASERGSTAQLVFWGTVGLCGFLVGWDLVF